MNKQTNNEFKEKLTVRVSAILLMIIILPSSFILFVSMVIAIPFILIHNYILVYNDKRIDVKKISFEMVEAIYDIFRTFIDGKEYGILK